MRPTKTCLHHIAFSSLRVLQISSSVCHVKPVQCEIYLVDNARVIKCCIKQVDFLLIVDKFFFSGDLHILLYTPSHLSIQQNFWSLRYSWNIACRHHHSRFNTYLTPWLNEQSKNNYYTILETLKLWDLMGLLLTVWRYIMKVAWRINCLCLPAWLKVDLAINTCQTQALHSALWVVLSYTTYINAKIQIPWQLKPKY